MAVDEFEAIGLPIARGHEFDDAVRRMARETRRLLERLPTAEVLLQIIDELKPKSVSPDPIDDLSDGGCAQNANHAAPVAFRAFGMIIGHCANENGNNI